MRGYVLSARARRDMRDIWKYGAERWDTDQAGRYARVIESSLKLLVKHPGIGLSCDEILEGYFRLSSGSHMIFYRVVRDQIRVVRILHQSMDYERHL